MDEIKGKSGRMYSNHELLFSEELADALRKSRTYVCAMKKSGFKMPGGTATIGEARAWLRENSQFSCTKYVKKTLKKTCNRIIYT